VLLSINNVNGKDIPRPCIGNCFSTIANPNKKIVEKLTTKHIYKG
jgi:hypothetical protein